MEKFEEYVQKSVKLEKNNSKNYILQQKEKISNNYYPRSFSNPLSIQYELTSKCNMYCRHCYNRSGENQQNDKMGIEQWKKLSEELVANGGVFQCVISGGEPLLLGDGLFEIMDILDADGTIFLLISNGYNMTEETVMRLKKYRYQWIQISIDSSSPESHDELRQKPGSWERAVNAALMVSDAGLPLAIANSVMPDEIDNFPDMAKLAYQCGASLLITGEILPSGRAAINNELLLSNEQRGKFWKITDNVSSLYYNRMSVRRSSSGKIQLEEAMELPNTGVIIRPNGDIRLECVAPFVIGNVLTASFPAQWNNGRDIWKHEKIAEYVNSIDQYSGVSTLHKNYVEGDICL